MKKRLKLSNDSMLMGVCGGIAEYFDIDPTIVRLIAVICFCTIPVTPVAYLVMGFVLPDA